MYCGRKSQIPITLFFSPTMIHLKVNKNITNKYELYYNWKVHNGIYKPTMKLFKTCMIAVSIHCCFVL